MKRFIYIITDRNRRNLHVGVSADLLKTLQFYQQLPSLSVNDGQQLNRLVYFEELSQEHQAINRFQYVSTFTRLQKEKIIRSVNPDWIDLTPALKQEERERNLTFRPILRAAATGRQLVTF